MGPTSGGATAETSKVGRGLRELALGVLEREGAGGRKRSDLHVPGSVPPEEGMHGGDSRSVGRVEQTEWMYSPGMKLSLDQAVEAWRVQRATLRTAPLSGTLDCLCRIADLGSFLLRQNDGSVKQLTSAVGPQTLAPHVDVRQVKHWFGEIKQFPHIDRLLRALSPGVPVDVAQGGHLSEEVEYGNHSGVRGHAEEVAKKVVTDVVTGRALVFNANFIEEIQGIRLSPLSVVEEPKFRIIHDLTFAGSGNRSSVNEDTEFDCAPKCELGHVLRDVSLRVLYLRQKYGPDARIVLARIDVKEAFRQVPVDPEGAPVFGYKFGNHVVVDLRLQFGWRSSPGFWGLFSAALEHAHTHTTFQHAEVTAHGAAAVDHVTVVPPRGGRAAALPRDCVRIQDVGGETGSEFFVRYYVDDGILVEIQWFPDGRRCIRAIQSLASDHFRLLGVRGPDDPALLSARKITSWDSRLEVLGWIVDTDELSVTMPPTKMQKLCRLMAEWPPSRTWAWEKQVSQLTGFLLHVAFVVRPGKFFVNRLLADVGMPQSAAASETSPTGRGRRVILGPEFHGDLEFWRWFATEGFESIGGCLSAPMFNLVSRPPQRTIFSDASKQAIGGFCLETGVYWRYDLTKDEQARFCGSSQAVKGMNDISINVLELLGMVISAWVLVVLCEDLPAQAGDCVLLRGDNEAAVQWVRRCRGGKEPRSGALMRFLGVLEMSSGWNFDALHVSGVLNDVADGISRWKESEVHANLVRARSHIPWQVWDLGENGRALCTSVLASSSSETPLRLRLCELTRGISVRGWSFA